MSLDNVVHPGKRLKELLATKGWTQDELAKIAGKSRQAISNIVSGRGGVTPEMAIALGASFGNSPAEWLKWAAEYELAVATIDCDDVQRRARLYSVAPIKDMAKRGWIEISDEDSDDVLEQKLSAFYGGDLTSSFQIAARRSAQFSALNSSEIAWFFRARQLASSILVKEFDVSRLGAAESQLRKAAAFSKDASKVAKILSEYGIRFVILEPLPTTKIDGAAFWLDDVSPVIALSLRFDRVDAFWFTLFHEFFHIKHGDAMSIDTDVLGGEHAETSISMAGVDAEQKANAAAANALIPSHEIESFIRRVAPYYSAERIVQFAHRVKMHPGVVVGQLQNRGEIGFHALRSFLVKVRESVVSTALTDGWGQLGPRLG